ncbi:hypothetical protein [Mycobacterium riyadhense]|uniref:Uncharacterized protein n=1 Tax=Mycobacterium riyadhense TaxID=486698 RepID=A0A1X2CBI8_9MYCO|nr:hypothetical protein [Mycobacterium riyadhense]MCV7148491.1 hypothetical protein [Mycobacterium riyadhense]ORW73191.1 hypothetical protein AWC22_01265 [Mycobacterium riyadhense]VTO95382.1 hypothetical protein BIN_B_00860 [Mycobacterium riyadhense]
MESSRGVSELRVSDDGLRAEAGECETLAGKLAGNSAPTPAVSTWLASASAVTVSNAGITAAGARCTFRMQATATNLAAAATGYTANEASSAAQLQGLARPTVC